MRFKRHLKVEYGLNPIYIVPLLNIVFLLFLFFAISTLFTSPMTMAVQFPRAITSEIIKGDHIVIIITGEDVIYFNNRVATIGELETALEQSRNTGSSVIIKADKKASLGRIADIWNLCRELEIDKISIVTDR